MSDAVHSVANEAALRHLASENQRLQLMLAQTVGNLALANTQLREAQAELAARQARKPREKKPAA